MKIKKFLGTMIFSLSSVIGDSVESSEVLVGIEEMPASIKNKR